MKESKVKVSTTAGKPYEIPEGGSIGLLALGYVGLMLWRQKRKEITELHGKSKT